MIERLHFRQGQRYNAIEAASHLARYMLVRSLCRGRRVLDIACGEGYGAYLMARDWGAAAVDAVDISPEAIAVGKELFAHEKIAYHCRAAEELDQLFPPGQFDLIVSLETLEHTADPERFLRALRGQLKPGGTLVLTCPNDWWYYRTPEERNPYHVRKFTLAEFLELASSIFGAPQQVLLGTPVAGFGNAAVESADLRSGAGEETPLALLGAHPPGDVLVLPSDEQVCAENCSYFAALWSAPASAAPVATTALFPCSMTSSMHATQEQSIASLRDEVAHLRTHVFDAEGELAHLKTVYADEQKRSAAIEAARAALEVTVAEVRRACRHAELRLAAQRAENEYMLEQARRLREKAERVDHLQQQLAGLERHVGELRQTIADQTKLVDERDAYIRRLEPRVDAAEAELRRVKNTRLWRWRTAVGGALRRITGRARQ